MRLLLGVTGGIAAYKSIELLRLLVAGGYDVTPILTPASRQFVGPVTFEALSGKRLVDSLWDGDDPIPHTTLGQSADLIVIAPATADFLARYAAGLCSDLLGATLIASEAPVIVAPAMHTEMWLHPATQRNIELLAGRGVRVLEPASGELAGGDAGIGRMREPREIFEAVEEVGASLPLSVSSGSSGRQRSDLEGLTILVTAGGTREALDPVRYIGNRSSGRMGHAIAEAAAERGGRVILVTASPLEIPRGVEGIRVEASSEMEKETLSRYGEVDAVFMAAAVADFKPRRQRASKIKKADGPPVIELEPTTDILGELGAAKNGQFLVGFAAETDELTENASKKLAAKNADLIVANDVTQPDAGFEVETNRATLLWADGKQEELPLAKKRVLADLLLDRLVERLPERR